MGSSIERFHCIQDTQLGPNVVLYREVPLYWNYVGMKLCLIRPFLLSTLCVYLGRASSYFLSSRPEIVLVCDPEM